MSAGTVTLPAPGSFIHQARRRQLIDAAIELIAEVGVDRASTVQIARRAGVSRGVLTYHFADRADLLAAVVATVYEVARPEVGPAVAAAPSPRGALLAFVTASIDFYARYPRHMAALRAIFDSREPSPSREDRAEHRGELDDLCRILAAGQDRGDLRAFDVPLMAATVRTVLDVCVRRVLAGEDPAHLRVEMAATIDAATRAAVQAGGVLP